MKFLFDLAPVLLFFAAYKFSGSHQDIAHDLATGLLGNGIATDQSPILIATAVAILVTLCQVGWQWWRHRHVDTMLWVSTGIIVLLGGATLLFHNPTFIKWKPTVLYWLFSTTLLISAVVFDRNLIRRLMEAQVKLPEHVWGPLNASWIVFFSLMGFLNLYVAYSYPEDTWVSFKLYGGTGLMIAFMLIQGYFLSKHVIEEES